MNDDTVSLGFDLTQILNKSEEDAVKILAGQGYKGVVSERDGTALVLTAELNLKRIKLTVNKGLVEAYSRG